MKSFFDYRFYKYIWTEMGEKDNILFVFIYL